MRIVVVLVVLLLAACQKSEPAGLVVDLQSSVETASVNEVVQFVAFVKYDDEPVTADADVQFEVIENGISYGNLPIKPSKEGEYELELKFIEPGEHQIISHVTYGEMHEMPTLTVEVE